MTSLISRRNNEVATHHRVRGRTGERGRGRILIGLAVTVNLHGWNAQGIKLHYDHISVKRWLTGATCQNPDVLAAVLSQA